MNVFKNKILKEKASFIIKYKISFKRIIKANVKVINKIL